MAALPLPCNPLCIEHAEAERDREAGEYPEPDHDRDLSPALQLEVMLQRGHLEHPPLRHLEVADLDDARHRDHDEQAAQYRRSEERRVGKECRSRWSPY